MRNDRRIIVIHDKTSDFVYEDEIVSVTWKELQNRDGSSVNLRNGTTEISTLSPVEILQRIKGKGPIDPHLLDRQEWAEKLISQLPNTSGGRNAWLMHYGVREEAIALRKQENVRWCSLTQSSEEKA